MSAGEDQRVTAGQAVSLSASVSSNDYAPYQFSWVQLSGPAVNLVAANAAAASFTAPSVSQSTNLLFQVSSVDNRGITQKDTVVVTVNNANSVLRFEAEDATLSGLSVATRQAGYSGTGYVTGFTDGSQSVTWTLDLEAGFYDMRIAFYADNIKGYDLTIDGVVSAGKTNAATQFSDAQAARLWLSEGSHSISVGGGWNYYQVDYLELTPMPSPAAPQAVAPQLVNTQASAHAKQLYQWLKDSYGAVTVSGQQDLADTQVVKNKTGQLPAIYSWDLLNYSSLTYGIMGEPSYTTEDFIVDIQANGYVASMLWHWHSPMHAKSTVNPCPNSNDSCWWNSFYTQHTDFDLAAALADPTSDEYQALLDDMDGIAAQLKKVQQANIPVLWRPLHEADGEWFWWGAAGAENFKALWRLMYQRFTEQHQLNNLIWVWTNEDAEWYPGDDVVDIIGVDAYPSDKADLLTGLWHKMYERFDGHKIIALTEVGGVPYVADMQQQGVWWSYFASWVNDLGPNKMSDQELTDIYTSTQVVTLEEVNLPAAPAPSGNKIMPLGDSITGSPGCWRQTLWAELQTAGLTDLDFVGRLDNSDHCGTNFDGDNEGHGGFKAMDIANDGDLVTWLNAANPDVVMMHLGTNDVWSNESTADILAAYTTLLDQMRANNSDVTLLVAQIIPLDPAETSCSYCYDGVVALNQAIPDWAASHTSEHSPVIVVDVFTGFDTNTDTQDGAHPIDSGNQKMAAQWLRALKALYL